MKNNCGVIAFDELIGRYNGRVSKISMDTIAAMARDNEFLLFPMKIPVSELWKFGQYVIMHHDNHFETVTTEDFYNEYELDEVYILTTEIDGHEEYVITSEEACTVVGSGFMDKIKKEVGRGRRRIKDEGRRFGGDVKAETSRLGESIEKEAGRYVVDPLGHKKSLSDLERDFRHMPEENPERFDMLTTAANFIPYVGPLVSAGMGVYGAKQRGESELAGGIRGYGLGAGGAAVGGGLMSMFTGGGFGQGAQAGVGAYTGFGSPLSAAYQGGTTATGGQPPPPSPQVTAREGAPPVTGAKAGGLAPATTTKSGELPTGGLGAPQPGGAGVAGGIAAIGGLAGMFDQRQARFEPPKPEDTQARERTEVGQAAEQAIIDVLGAEPGTYYSSIVENYTLPLEQQLDRDFDQNMQDIQRQFEAVGMGNSMELQVELGKLIRDKNVNKTNMRIQTANTLFQLETNLRQNLIAQGIAADESMGREILGYADMAATEAGIKYQIDAANVEAIRTTYGKMFEMGMKQWLGIFNKPQAPGTKETVK